MRPVTITRANATDSQALGTVIGSAFAEDPVNLWIFRTTPNIVRTFSLLARSIYLPRGECFWAGDLGGAMWLPPGASNDLPLLPLLSAACGAVLRIEPGPVLRALKVSGAMERHHPKAPHYYLFAVGVNKQARGQGIARQLVAPVLARCDAAGIPAYLENSNPRNTSFYQSLGFVAREIFIPAPGCPELMPMWREPAGAA